MLLLLVRMSMAVLLLLLAMLMLLLAMVVHRPPVLLWRQFDHLRPHHRGPTILDQKGTHRGRRT